MTRHPVKADPLHLAPMLLLTFSTGVIDAVGYLGLDRVFTGNMTGNVVLLGMAFTGETSLPLLRPSLALGGFLVGAALGGRVLRRFHPSADGCCAAPPRGGTGAPPACWWAWRSRSRR